MSQITAMKKQDRIFNGLAQRFNHRIYSNPKGKIRLAITQDDLQQTLDLSQPLNVLDMGAGLGQMSCWLAQQGHKVTLCEPADDMLSEAKQMLDAEGLSDHVLYRNDTLQTLSQTDIEPFDLIIFHAVLEWMADPQQAIADLLTLLKPKGYLSIMFYNHHSAVMRSLMVADFKRIKNNYIAAMGNKGFTPISPLEPAQVKAWFDKFGVEILNWSGVRAFYDYMHPQAREKVKLNDVLEMERKYSKIEPWQSLARYQHVIVRYHEN